VGDAVVAESDLPAVGVGVVAGFDDAVVVGADECQILKRGVAACPPGDQVVGVAADGWGVAAGEDAALVALFEGCADGWGDEALGASDVEDVGGSAEDDGEQVGVAGRVVFARNSGKLCFATLQDGDGTQLQAMISPASAGRQSA